MSLAEHTRSWAGEGQKRLARDREESCGRLTTGGGWRERGKALRGDDLVGRLVTSQASIYTDQTDMHIVRQQQLLPFPPASFLLGELTDMILVVRHGLTSRLPEHLAPPRSLLQRSQVPILGQRVLGSRNDGAIAELVAFASWMKGALLKGVLGGFVLVQAEGGGLEGTEEGRGLGKMARGEAEEGHGWGR
jgi:hypothetical protein